MAGNPASNVLLLPLIISVTDSIIPDALGKSEISSLVISCKEDNPPQLRQVDGDFNNQIKSRYPKVEICSTSANVPESQKRCISLILRSILKSRTGKALCFPKQPYTSVHLVFVHPVLNNNFSLVAR